MSAYVVDVNVPIVANGRSNQADAKCQLSCVQALKEVREGILCLDDGGHILGEYRRHLSPSGQPGVGDEFMQWLIQNQYRNDICERVTIARNSDRGFNEFPDDNALSGFDADDRKYVAVAMASNHEPRILNAVDSDWGDFESELRRHGLNIRQLCPDCLTGDESPHGGHQV